MKTLKMHFLNTIWSDAILLESNSHYAFIDTASAFYYPMIKDYLDSKNILDLDFIILTHFHSDHYGNLSKIVNEYNVKKVYLKRYYGLDGSTASGFASNEEYIENEFKKYHEIIDACIANNTEIIYIDELGLDSVNLAFDCHTLELYDIKNTLNDIYNDKNSIYYQKKAFNENYNSIGIFIKINRYNVFLAADSTCSLNEYLPINKLANRMVNKYYARHNANHIDIYKSAHHGGGGTNSLELSKLLKAKYVIITNTNRWLDNWNTFSNLKEGNKKVKIYQTDYQKVIFTISNKIDIQEIKEDSLFLTLKKN